MSLRICVFRVGEHISRVRCVDQAGEQVSLRICVSQVDSADKTGFIICINSKRNVRLFMRTPTYVVSGYETIAGDYYGIWSSFIGRLGNFSGPNPILKSKPV